MGKKIPFIDLFSGAGGLSIGFEQAGFRSVFANDYDPMACDSYTQNHKQTRVFCGDVAELDAKRIYDETGLNSIPLVIGGPNCQGRKPPRESETRMIRRTKCSVITSDLSRN